MADARIRLVYPRDRWRVQFSYAEGAKGGHFHYPTHADAVRDVPRLMRMLGARRARIWKAKP